MIARLDLSDMPDLVKVLSGNVDSVNELGELRARIGDDPKDWLPLFCGWNKQTREAPDAA